MITALLIFSAPADIVVGQKISPECELHIVPFFQRANTEKLVAYEVNSDYVLLAEFDKNCDLVRVDVSPKYSWDYLQPDWKEPKHSVGLLDDQYGRLLTKIGQMKPLGSLIHKGEGGNVSNSTLWLLDRYSKAFVERGMSFVLGDQTEPSQVRIFTIYFIRSVSGRVSDKRLDGISTVERTARLKIAGRWYRVDESEYKKAVKGRQGDFRAAGPVG